MQQQRLSPFSILGLTGALALAGCAGNVTFDTTESFPAATTTMSNGIQGSNFGGHAPIVGAKVFLLQAGTSGYGSKSTSLLNSTAGGTDMTIVGSSGSPAYYTPTDTAGYFNVTGQYTCTSGMPVYLYAYAGAPDTNPSVGPSNISSASGSSASGNLVVTFVVDNEKFYVGQSVMFGTVTGTFSGFSNTTQVVSAISTTDNKSFSVTLGASNSTFASAPATGTVSPIGVQNPGIVNVAMLGNCPSPFTISAQVLNGNPVLTSISASDAAKLTNANVTANTWGISGPGLPSGTTISFVNVSGGVAILSNSDSSQSGVAYTFTVTPPFTFGPNSSTPINFVYMNEVSTAAAMFAMAPFAESSTISNGVVTRTATDAQHIGIPASNSLALTGIQNAAVNAGQLYDLAGGNIATGCGGTYANPTGPCANGEAHVARLSVPNSGNGQGVATVPQALIDTLGNILAACVDSANTYGLGATGGTASPPCKTLFQTATSNGIPVSSFGATTPTDTATAAINIAHYPAGNGSNAGSFVSNLFALPTGVVPFVPNLSTAPTDFMIGINITVPQGSNPTNYLGSSGTTPAAAKPTAIATNAYGEAFVGTTGCGSGGAESATNGYGCVLQIEPTQLLPGLPTVAGVGYAQGVRAVALGPAGKLWATGTIETGQTVGGFTPTAGGFYIVVNSPSPTTPIVTGASSTALAFAPFGNTGVNGILGTYTNFFGQPTAIALNGNAHAYIADSTKGYLHDITGVTPGGGSVYTYNAVNPDSDYLIAGVVNAGNGTQSCQANISALAIGNSTPATTANGSGAYNIWSTSTASTATQGMCTIPDPNATNLTPATGNSPTVNAVTPISQVGPQHTPTWVAVDANDVGWDANQGDPSGNSNQVVEGFPNNGLASYGGTYGFASSNTTFPSGVAIDGNNNLWVTNMGSNSVSAYTSPGKITGLNSATAISPAGTTVGNTGGGNNGNGGYKAGGTLSGPSAIAIDLSGNVWVINTSSSGVGYSVTELIGVAAPTYAPLSAATAVNKLGAKP